MFHHSSPSTTKSDTRTLRVKLQGDHYNFTPRASPRSAPRAWERKPATPFAPRTEGQKIWKRSNAKQQGGVKGVVARRERWRSVKRLRVVNEDNDVGFVGTKYEESVQLDLEREKRRKLVNEELCDALRWIGEAKRVSRKSSDMDTDVGMVRRGVEEGSQCLTSLELMSVSTTTTAQEEQSCPKAKIEIQEIHRRQITAGAMNDAESFQIVDAPLDGRVVDEVCNPSTLTESEDTEYLHAFLTRARAKKTAQAILCPVERMTIEGKDMATSMATLSPQTRSRTALANLDGNSPSPKRLSFLELLPSGKSGQDSTILSNIDPASQLGKSTRTRQPRPQRDQPAAPNTIPFRRSNGTEFIFLQKTEAQEVAIATRSNTRRNKGEALQPKMKLEALSTQVHSSPIKVAKVQKNNKRVSWDEGLAYFAPVHLSPLVPVEESAQEKTPVKRSRRLASSKGTPAPKKKMAKAAVLDLPTPNTRTRTRAKNKI